MWTAENAVWNSKAVYMWLNMTQHKRWSNEDQTGGRILQRCFLRGLKRRLRGLKAVFSLFSKLQLIYINNGRRVKLRPPETIWTPLPVNETDRARPTMRPLPVNETNRARPTIRPSYISLSSSSVQKKKPRSPGFNRLYMDC